MDRKEWAWQWTLRLAGCAGIVAALLAVMGDVLSQYSPQGYASPEAVERAMPFWRLLSGELLGVIGIPLCLFGYWCVCQVLRREGVRGTGVMFWLIAFGLAMGVVSHAIISSVYIVMQAGDPATVQRITGNLQLAALLPGLLFLLGYLAFSAWYLVVVLFGRDQSRPYPRWLAFVNPFLLSLLIALLNAAHVAPSVLNVLWPAWLSVPHLVFFTLATLLLWNVGEPRGSAATENPF